VKSRLLRLFRFSLLLPLLAGVSACGQKGMFSKGVQPVQIDPMQGPDRATRIAQARTAAAAGELRCDFDGECHPSVALISVVTDQGLARCSGVLISEDEVLTNDHCVSLSLSAAARPDRLEEIPCGGEIYANFAPTNDATGFRAECRSIRYRSGERGIGSVDFAILKLAQKPGGRQPIVLARKGLSNGDETRVFRVQMDGDSGFGGTQSLLRCQASHRTFVYPQIDSADTPLMTLGDCPIVLGNSGAPVINVSGELSGIIQGYLALRQSDQLEQELRDRLLDGTFGLTGVATQTHCLDRIGADSPATCIPLPQLQSMSVGEFVEKLLPEGPESFPELSAAWKWYPDSNGAPDSRAYRSGPVCASVPEFDSEELRFKSGIDSRLQAVWRRTDEDRQSLLLKKTVETPDSVIYGSGSVSLGIPACQAL
jgi:hypothetical protein